MANRIAEKKLPCEACNTTSYITPFSNPGGYIVCNLTCYYTKRWLVKWNYRQPIAVNPKYQHTKGKKRCKE